MTFPARATPMRTFVLVTGKKDLTWERISSSAAPFDAL
jgi:hypothetical protein